MSLLDIDFLVGSSVDGVAPSQSRGVTANSSLSIAAFAYRGGELLVDLSPRLRGGKFSTGRHGYEAFSGFYPCTQGEAFRLYDRPGLPHVSIAWGGLPIWDGRLEDLGLDTDAGGIDVGAFGYWRALKRARYTALWSATRFDDWRVVTPQDSSVYRPDRWQFNTTNQLYIAPRENEYYDITDDRGGLTVAAPNGGSRNIAVVTFDYTVTVPSSTWVARMLSFTDAWGSVTAEWTQTGSGSGSATVTLTSPNPRLVFELFYNSGSETQWTGARTGSAFARITNLRVKSTSSSSVYADEIARALASYVNGINSAQLSAVTASIDSPGIDLRDEVYEDMPPADILDRLALLGDGTNVWETGVEAGGYLYFRRRGSQGRTWYTDAAQLIVNRSVDSLANSMYAIYQEAGGRALRTAKSTDADSVARWGETVEDAVNIQTTSATQAGSHRDVALGDRKTPIPAAQFRIGAIYDAAGARYPKFLVRAGDTIVARNLPPTLSTDIDRLRSFRVAATEYLIDSDDLNATPESYLPSLDVLVARQGAGIAR